MTPEWEDHYPTFQRTRGEYQVKFQSNVGPKFRTCEHCHTFANTKVRECCEAGRKADGGGWPILHDPERGPKLREETK